MLTGLQDSFSDRQDEGKWYVQLNVACYFQDDTLLGATGSASRFVNYAPGRHESLSLRG